MVVEGRDSVGRHHWIMWLFVVSMVEILSYIEGGGA